MMNIICTAKDLKKYELQEKSEVTVTIRLSQKIILDKHVISRWKLVEEIEEIYTLTFNFHCALKKHNMLHNKSYYQVQRNAAGTPVLIRVSE